MEVRVQRTGDILQVKIDYLGVHRGENGIPRISKPRFGAVAVNHNGTSGGLFVTHLVPGSPAAQIQLEYGDIILEINGRPINDQKSYAAAVAESDRTMDLIILNVRNGQRQSFQVTLDH
jgi:S1-C subfamily serine protease